MKLTGENRSTQRKTCPSATLSTTNPTWTDPGSNPGLHGGRLAANSLSHGMASTGLNHSYPSILWSTSAFPVFSLHFCLGERSVCFWICYILIDVQVPQKNFA
jgi:hypothetical protein